MGAPRITRTTAFPGFGEPTGRLWVGFEDGDHMLFAYLGRRPDSGEPFVVVWDRGHRVREASAEDLALLDDHPPARAWRELMVRGRA